MRAYIPKELHRGQRYWHRATGRIAVLQAYRFYRRSGPGWVNINSVRLTMLGSSEEWVGNTQDFHQEWRHLGEHDERARTA